MECTIQCCLEPLPAHSLTRNASLVCADHHDFECIVCVSIDWRTNRASNAICAPRCMSGGWTGLTGALPDASHNHAVVRAPGALGEGLRLPNDVDILVTVWCTNLCVRIYVS